MLVDILVTYGEDHKVRGYDERHKDGDGLRNNPKRTCQNEEHDLDREEATPSGTAGIGSSFNYLVFFLIPLIIFSRGRGVVVIIVSLSYLTHADRLSYRGAEDDDGEEGDNDGTDEANNLQNRRGVAEVEY